MAFFVFKTYRGLEQEEAATLRYFAETLFDEMEQALAVLVQKEEGRAIDEFNYHVFPSGRQRGAGEPQLSPLSQIPRENYILGYFQNNPDGSFQTPLVETGGRIPPERANLISDLKDANEVFNRKRVMVTDRVKSRPAEIVAEKESQQKTGLADKYLDLSRTQRSKTYLGQTEKRLEKITVNQAANIAKQESPQVMSSAPVAGETEDRKDDRRMAEGRAAGKAPTVKKRRSENPIWRNRQLPLNRSPAADTDEDEAAGFQVEVAPLRAVFLNDAQIFIFRRIMINNQIYRQGFVLGVDAFLDYLTRTYFLTQPLAQFTALRLSVVDQGREANAVQTGVISHNPDFILNRGFPSPFSFLKASLTCERIPAVRRAQNTDHHADCSGGYRFDGFVCHLPQCPGHCRPFRAAFPICFFRYPRIENTADQYPDVYRDAGTGHCRKPGARTGIFSDSGLGRCPPVTTHQQCSGIVQIGKKPAAYQPANRHF